MTIKIGCSLRHDGHKDARRTRFKKKHQMLIVTLSQSRLIDLDIWFTDLHVTVQPK